jgi:hypothetical protein
MKKTSLIFAVTALLFTSAFGQTVPVLDEYKKLQDKEWKGYSSIVMFDKETVLDAWIKELKKYGKVETNNNGIKLTGANMPSVSTDLFVMQSAVSSTQDGTKIWLAGDKDYPKLKEYLQTFSTNMYKFDLQKQIEEAESVILMTNKNYEKKVKEHEVLLKKIENNIAEKLKLEQALQQNAIDLKNFEAAVEKNKLEKQGTLEEIEKVKKIIEVKKEKLKIYN